MVLIIIIRKLELKYASYLNSDRRNEYIDYLLVVKISG